MEMVVYLSLLTLRLMHVELLGALPCCHKEHHTIIHCTLSKNSRRWAYSPPKLIAEYARIRLLNTVCGYANSVNFTYMINDLLTIGHTIFECVENVIHAGRSSLYEAIASAVLAFSISTWLARKWGRGWWTEFPLLHVSCVGYGIIVAGLTLVGLSLRFVKPLVVATISAWGTTTIMGDTYWQAQVFAAAHSDVQFIAGANENHPKMETPSPLEGGSLVMVDSAPAAQAVSLRYANSAIEHFYKHHPLLALCMSSDVAPVKSALSAELTATLEPEKDHGQTASSLLRRAVIGVTAILIQESDMVVLAAWAGLFTVFILLSIIFGAIIWWLASIKIRPEHVERVWPT